MAKQLSSFEKAFAAARKDKQKEFTWNNKKYTTEYKEEKAAREAKAKTGTSTASSSTQTQTSSSATTPARAAPPAAPAKPSGIFRDLLTNKDRAAANQRALEEKRKAKEAAEKAEREKEQREKQRRASQVAPIIRKPKEAPKKEPTRQITTEEGWSGDPEDLARAGLYQFGQAKGGKVKKYASGGKVSSASKRADGIAIRGKTRAR